MALAGEKRDIMTKSALEADMRLVRIEDGRLEVALERNAARGLVNDLSRKLEQWTGRRWTVIVSNEAGAADAALAERGQEESSTPAPRKPIRASRKCWRGFPAPRSSKYARLAAEPPESDATGEDPTETFPTATTIDRQTYLLRKRDG